MININSNNKWINKGKLYEKKIIQYYVARNYFEAELLARKIIEEEILAGQGHKWLGLILAAKNQYEESFNELTIASKLNSSDHEIYLNLGFVLRKLNRLNE